MHCTMDPSFTLEKVIPFTPLDFAGLEDLGWNSSTAAPAGG